jgi:hypothetical protein
MRLSGSARSPSSPYVSSTENRCLSTAPEPVEGCRRRGFLAPEPVEGPENRAFSALGTGFSNTPQKPLLPTFVLYESNK